METKWRQNGDKNGNKQTIKMAIKWRQNGKKMAKKDEKIAIK